MMKVQDMFFVVFICVIISVVMSQRCTNSSVNGSPVLNFTPFPLKAVPGGEVDIVCVAVRPMDKSYVTPNPFEIIFLKEGKVLKVDGCVDDPYEKAKQIKVCLLKLKDITEKDAAVYTCLGRNAHGCTYSKLNLTVKGSVSPKEKFLRWRNRFTGNERFQGKPLVF